MGNCKFFSKILLGWNESENKRKMPWKGETDPFRIWISEIILQQTRVQQGLEYYNRFIVAFPTVQSLANADEKEVYKLWEGLGYYSRCKNLIISAKFIYEKLNGRFPRKYEDILALKGIGSYTASAISSFAFNEPYAVLDGNVFRVLSRFFGIEIPINTTEGKKYYGEIAQSLLDKKYPGKYNQALMDFGAVVCKPAAPLCLQCPLQKKCTAFSENKVNALPVNTKKISQKNRFFNYLLVHYKNKYYVRKRTGKDIWENLYEFILIESNEWLDESAITVNEQIRQILNLADYRISYISSKKYQKLTHQIITGKFIHVEIQKPLVIPGYFPVNGKQLKSLPFPKLIASYLADKNVSLN
ncbi:MAG: A/G-specific adenine glycosylase [Ginsengibacter sp.]